MFVSTLILYFAGAPVGAFILFDGFWKYSSSHYMTGATSEYYLIKTCMYYGDYVEQCTDPVVSYEQDKLYEATNERQEMTNRESFESCFVASGASTLAATLHNRSTLIKMLSAIMYTIPQMQFSMGWNNFLGFSLLPQNTFTSPQSSMSSETLAQQAFPSRTTTAYACVIALSIDSRGCQRCQCARAHDCKG